MNITPKKLSVKIKGASYPIVIGVRLEKELLRAVAREGKRRIAIIADTKTHALFGSSLVRALKKDGRAVDLLSFPPGERRKNQKTVVALHHALLKKHFGRDTLIIALGGGVVGDVAGFVAATYLRGVPYIQIPTTLMAIIDSSVGGKVGVDTKYGKNLIGAFYQPRAVIADISRVASLPERQVVNGLIEAVKKFITNDKHSLPLALQFDTAHPLKDPRLLQRIVYASVRSKVRVVMADEEEHNERRILNFGHTVGHAIEFVSKYTLPHGFAVAYGMLVEAKVAELLGILPPEERFLLQGILARFGFEGSALKRYPVGKVLHALKGDKKARRGVPHYVLLKRVGSVYTKGGQYAHPVSERIVRKAYEAARSAP
ncbi:3-dehydroquinate synthase [Candidatus Kaiserbacteria bacterium RIFCSPHIGHO2_01_FULL_55_17]|uniref:3-dehydroquinate synthase n=1 Tax=Candidatus Kaiserbacteria bacterium RIFCSPHIGHO2_01_FULL_55_17 TaxID=1798484 RepID=A0A1F6D812_9BACT|nr:MAG: 3-dehydroquinate synthase [Candidatus Kaiserbacteria bacterium RIFCSPHIGHO2_01_FULL_55_17]